MEQIIAGELKKGPYKNSYFKNNPKNKLSLHLNTRGISEKTKLTTNFTETKNG